MALAFVLSCLLTCLPSIVAMAVVKHAGVNLSGPQGSPINDDPIYYRWDEGLPGSVVRFVQSARVELGRRSVVHPDTDWGWAPGHEGRGDLVIWEIDADVTD